MKRVLFALSLTLGLAGGLRADARFDPPPQQSGKLSIEVSDAAVEPQLIIPRKLLTGADKKGAALPGMSTIVAGLALTLAFASGGLWLARQRRSSAWPIAAVALLGLSAAAALADRAPNPQPKPLAQLDRLHVIVVERGEQIRLIINKKQLAELTEAKK